MLRALVLLFLLVNAALYYWLHSDPQALQADREPQRLGHQVAPDAIQVLPDLPAASASGGPQVSAASASGAELAVGAASSASTSASTVDAPASGVAIALARKTSAAELDCVETPPVDDAQFAALKQALAKAGVPADAVTERRQPQAGSWMVYLGRFTDSQAWQQKADELKKLDVKFERVNTPALLTPGLALGEFTSSADAVKKLDAMARRGVHGARVVTLTAPAVLRHLQVRAAGPAWHHATGAQRFNSCLADPPSST